MQWPLPTLYSTHTVITLAVVVAIAWLLRGYPEWRNRHLRQSHSIENETSQAIVTESKHTRPDISVAHYILVMPLATFYIVARALIDVLRFGLYRLVWAGEQAAPQLDDWLFEKVTIQWPARVRQCEAWWSTRGIHLWKRVPTFLAERAIPATVHTMDACFAALYRAGQWLHRTSAKCHTLWQQLWRMHDWTQLAMRLYDASVVLVWTPCSKLVLRLHRLACLVYHGLRHTAVSLADDVSWVVMVLIPNICVHVTSVFPIEAVDRVVIQTAICVRRMFGYFTVSPVYERLVQGIDSLVDFVETELARHFWARGCRVVLPLLVWLFADALSLVSDTYQTTVVLVEQLVLPALSVFAHVVAPRLSKEYRKATARLALLYEHHLYPRLQQSLARALCMLSIPFGHIRWVVVMQLTRVWEHAIVLGHMTLKAVASTLNLCMTHASVLAQTLSVQLPWPAVPWSTIEVISQTFWSLVMCIEWKQAWHTVYVDLTALWIWFVEQLNLVLASLERTAGDWAQSKSNNDSDHTAPKEKGTTERATSR